MKQAPFKSSRENHLNHMVKVVPLIAGVYAVQCYFILQMGHSGFAADSLLFLGISLGLMIAGFITYDLKHKVEFMDDYLEISFFNYHRKINYFEIVDVKLSIEGQPFSTIILSTRDGSKYRFFFLDDGDKIKSWIMKQNYPISKAA